MGSWLRRSAGWGVIAGGATMLIGWQWCVLLAFTLLVFAHAYAWKWSRLRERRRADRERRSAAP